MGKGWHVSRGLIEEAEAGAWTGAAQESQNLSSLLQRHYVGTYSISFRARRGAHITYNWYRYEQRDLRYPV